MSGGGIDKSRYKFGYNKSKNLEMKRNNNINKKNITDINGQPFKTLMESQTETSYLMKEFFYYDEIKKEKNFDIS